MSAWFLGTVIRDNAPAMSASERYLQVEALPAPRNIAYAHLLCATVRCRSRPSHYQVDAGEITEESMTAAQG